MKKEVKVLVRMEFEIKHEDFNNLTTEQFEDIMKEKAELEKEIKTEMLEMFEIDYGEEVINKLDVELKW